MKNISFFYLKNFRFLEVKFSIYLNRRVFVMVSWTRPASFSQLGFISGPHISFQTSRINDHNEFNEHKDQTILTTL